MGRNIDKTCNICLKKIGWGHLKRHMRTHQHGGNTGMIKNDKEAINVEEVEKKIFNEKQGFKRNLDYLKSIRLVERKKNFEDITWWQKGLRIYLDDKYNR